SIRCCGSSGPSISGSGRIDGTPGIAAAEPRPLASSCASASASRPAGSLISQMPIPSTPAAVYARTSAVNVDARVVICEIEKRGRMQAILCLSGPQEPAEPRGEPLRRGGLQERLRDHCPGARAETGARPRARADVEEAVDRGSVSRLPGKRAPEEILIERQRARIRVALLEIGVRCLEIGRREH